MKSELHNESRDFVQDETQSLALLFHRKIVILVIGNETRGFLSRDWK